MGIFDNFKKNKIQNENLNFSDNWDIYFSERDGAHFVRFDTSVGNITEDVKKQYPHIIELQVPITDLYDPSETARLAKIEDNFSHGSYDVRFIGALTYNDSRSFVFCCGGAEADINSIIKTLMSANKNVEYSFEVFLNNNLRYYDEVFAPNVHERNWMSNRHLDDAMRNQGEAFKKPREIDFFWWFDSDRHIAEISDKLCEKGFKELHREKAEDGKYSLHLVLNDIPEFNRMNKITSELIDLTDGTDGVFDGWGCSVVKDGEGDKNG